MLYGWIVACDAIEGRAEPSRGLFVMHVPGSRAQRCLSELTFGLKSQRSPIKTRFMDVCARKVAAAGPVDLGPNCDGQPAARLQEEALTHKFHFSVLRSPAVQHRIATVESHHVRARCACRRLTSFTLLAQVLTDQNNLTGVVAGPSAGLIFEPKDRSPGNPESEGGGVGG